MLSVPEIMGKHKHKSYRMSKGNDDDDSKYHLSSSQNPKIISKSLTSITYTHYIKESDAYEPACVPSGSKAGKNFQYPAQMREAANYSDETVDWKQYKSMLTGVFFTEYDIIQRGTKLYYDFWNFLTKYTAVQLKRGKEFRPISDEKSSVHKFPLQYDKKYCINFFMNDKNIDTLRAKLPPVDSDIENTKILTTDMLTEFSFIIHLFLDFTHKQKFKKLRKLREAQTNLPISDYRSQVIETVQKYNIVILAGDTGCGKSTQVPQFLLSAGFSNIACTQPRRIACISLCKRVSYETLNEYGSAIGYQIRFERKKTVHSKVIFLTEGLLLRQISLDPVLLSYNIIILDEIHERHLQTDFLLGIVKCLIMQRPDIRVILMSATINIDLFRNYFMGKAPVIQIPGRLYPIDVKYFPISQIERADKSGKLNPGPFIRILQLIDKTYPSDERGDVLIFLSGIKEITTVVEAACLYAQQTNKWVVLPLHSTLSLSEQEKVFDIAPEGIRKCIVSTNIAETSVTIDGIRFVIDSGKVKEMSYDSLHKMQRLKEFWVSQASAEQRKGRAGRTGPGVCFRLYSENEYDLFSQYSVPEVQRVPLDSIVLQLISLGLPDIRLFPFIDSPPTENLETSLNNLKSHSALANDEQLTTVGRILSQIPLDVSLGKMLIMGSLFRELGPVLSLVASMSVQSPFTVKAYRDPDCTELIKPLHCDHGDPFTLLALYREWLYMKTDSRENLRRWCKKRGLEEQRFYEITKLRQQFTEMLRENGLLDLSGTEASTSNERMKRLGELSQLNKLKRALYNEGPRKAKVLKVDHEGGPDKEDADGERDVNLEIKDIDFKIRYDNEKLKELYKSSKVKSSKELILLKLILCSGLYPNIGIADEQNNYKASSEQYFHTKSKPFVALHPNSVFAFDPEVLQLSQSEVIETPGSQRFPISSKHQLLTFISLLETNKAYMMNSMRVPAAQILLLFAHNIDCNADFTVVVCDEFVELTFMEPATAQNLIFQAVRLRTKWKEFLELRIRAKNPTVENKDNMIKEADHIERELSVGLVDVYLSEPIYSMKRLLDADIKVLYKGYDVDELSAIHLNPLTNEPFIPNTEKGGVFLTEYFTYNCLLDMKSAVTAISSCDAFCPYCDQEFHMSSLERLGHLQSCINKIASMQEPSPTELDGRKNHNEKEYYCEMCQKTSWMTVKEIFKHKNSHLHS